MNPGPVPGRIRGAALRELLEWYQGRHGGSAVTEIAEALQRRENTLFHPDLPAFGLLSHRWYEASDIHALLDAISERSDPREVAMEGGRIVTQATLSGLFRMIFRAMATPTRYAAHAHRLWSQYYDHGEFLVEPDPAAPRSLTTVRGWTAHHGMLCHMNVAAAGVIYEAMGQRGVSVRRLGCVAQGEDACRYEVRWDGS